MTVKVSINAILDFCCYKVWELQAESRRAMLSGDWRGARWGGGSALEVCFSREQASAEAGRLNIFLFNAFSVQLRHTYAKSRKWENHGRLRCFLYLEHREEDTRRVRGRSTRTICPSSKREVKKRKERAKRKRRTEDMDGVKEDQR